MKRLRPTSWVSRPHGRKPVSRARQAIGLIVLLLILSGAAAYRYITDEHRLRGYAERWLADFSGGQARVERVEIAPFGGLHLVGVTIATPDETGFFPPAASSEDRVLFSAATVLLRLQPFSMITGDLVVPQIIAVNSKLTLVERESDGLSNWEATLARRKPGKPGKGPPRLPEIRLRNIEVQQYRFNERGRVGGTVQTFFAGARPQPDRPEVYDLELTKIVGGGESENWTGQAGQLAIDMTTGAVSGSLPPLSLDELRFAASPEINRWLDTLELSGYVRAETFRFDPKGGTQATLKLQQARLSVPIDEHEARTPAAGRYVQFSNVAGTIHLDGREAQVRLEGLFRESPIRLDGRMILASDTAGGLAGFGLDVDLTASGVPLPRCGPETGEPEKRFVQRWHRLAAFVYDFDGRGPVDLSIRLHKEPGSDKGIEFVEGKLTARGVEAAFKEFAYRLHGITGEVQFRRDGKIDLIRLTGTHGGGKAVISGELGGPSRYDSVRLDIIGQRIEVDDDLLACMREDDRLLCGTFLERATVDLNVHLERPSADPAGPRAAWTSTVEAAFLDGRFRYAAFPYPLDDLRGQVRIAGGSLRMQDLSGRRGEARVRVSGTADRQGARAGNVDVRLEAEGLPLDERLAEALPKDVRQVYRRYSPTGRADLFGRLHTQNQGGPLAFDLKARLADAAVTLPESRARVERIEGTLRVLPDALEAIDLTGRLGDSLLSLAGAIGISSSRTGMSIRVTSDSLQLGSSVRSALPEALGAAYDSLEPQGRVRLDLQYRSSALDAASQPAGQPASRPVDGVDYAVVVEPLDCRVKFDAFPLPLEDVRGRVTITPAETRFEQISGRHGETHIVLSGRIPAEATAPAVEISSLEAQNVQFTEPLRQAMPWRLKRMWGEMRPTGACDLQLRDIRVFRAPDDRRKWELSGRVAFRGMGMSAGPVFSGVDGTLEGTIGFDGQFHADTALNLKQAYVDGRLVGDARAIVRRLPGSSAVTIEDVLATFYEGRLLGEIEVDYATRPPTFGLTIAARDVSLEGFVNADRAPDAKPIQAKGRIEGTLSLTGRFGRPESRQGSGSVVIQEAQMLKLPMILSIMRIVHMAIDDDNAFHDALFDFIVDGDDVILERIDLRGKAISMVGAGRVQASSTAMHLVLLVGSPLKLPKVLILSELVEGVARELMEVHVEGTLDSPLFRAEIARSIRQTVEAMTQVRVRRDRLGAGDGRSDRDAIRR